MKRFVKAGMLVVVMLGFVFPGKVQAQELKTQNKEICKGGSVFIDGGLFKDKPKDCEITYIKANGANLTPSAADLKKLLDENVVSPLTTTTYTIGYEIGGVTKEATAIVTVNQPPTLKVKVTAPSDYNPTVGICEEKSITISVLERGGNNVYWNQTPEKDFVVENTSKTYPLDESCKITVQSYNNCGFVDTVFHITVLKKPDLTNTGVDINPDMNGTFCAECGITPTKLDMNALVKSGTAFAPTPAPKLTWEDGSITEVPLVAGKVFEKKVTLEAVVTQSNACGAETKQIKTTFTLRLNGVVDCSPKIQDVVSLTPCRDQIVKLENFNKNLIEMVGEPALTTPGKLTITKDAANFPYVEGVKNYYHWKVRWDNYKQSDPVQSLKATANYKISCPYSAANPKITKSFTKDPISVQVDTSYLSFKYEYCPDGQALLEVSGKQGAVTINNVELVPATPGFASLFNATDVAKAHMKQYTSKDNITTAKLPQYTPLTLQVKFNVKEGTCDFSITRKEDLKLKQRGNCTMKFELGSSNKCIGEDRTLSIADEPDGLVVDDIVVEPHAVFAIQMEPKDAANPKIRTFKPYYAGAYDKNGKKLIASKTDSIVATMTYHMTGSNQSLSLTKKFELKVEACPPYINEKIIVNGGEKQACPMCPGVRFKVTVEFPNKSKDNNRSSVVLKSSVAYSIDKASSKWNDKQYDLVSYLFGDANYRIAVKWNEGDSVYSNDSLTYTRSGSNIQDGILSPTYGSSVKNKGETLTANAVGMANICGVAKDADLDSVCEGDDVDLKIYSRNLFETLERIEWAHPDVQKVNTGEEDFEYPDVTPKRNIKRYHYTVKAKAPGIYPFKLTTKIRDTTIVHYDTVRIAVLKKPYIFVQDSVFTCANERLDLNTYVDTKVVHSVQNPSGLIIASASNDLRVATASLRYTCKAIGSTIKDTIWVRTENPVYNVPGDDVALCPGESIELKAGTNGRITWTRRQKRSGGGYSAPDTLLVNGKKDEVLYDKMGKDTVLYAVTAHTFCKQPPKPSSVTVQFMAFSKPEPRLEIIDGSACYPTPLPLRTQPISAEVDSNATNVQWFVNGTAATSGSITPSAPKASYTVVCQATGKNGCKSSDTLKMGSYDVPAIKIGIDGSSGFSGNVYCVKPGTSTVKFKETKNEATAWEWYLASRKGVNISTAKEYILNTTAKDDTLYLKGAYSGAGSGCPAWDTMFIYSAPTIRATSDTISCVNEPLSIPAIAPADVNYAWYAPNGAEICSCAALVFAPFEQSDAGTYQLRYSRKGCEERQDVKVDMYPVPKYSFTDSLFCQGNRLKLGVNPGLSSEWLSKTSFKWYKGSTVLGTTQQYTGSALSTADGGYYRLEIKVNNLCLSTDSVLVKVDTPARAAFSLDPFYCEGSTMTTRAEDRGERAEYRWYSDNRQFEPYGTNTQISWPELTLDDSTMMCLVVKRGLCFDTARHFLHVRPMPKPQLSAENSKTDDDGIYYCEGEPITLRVGDARVGDSMRWLHNSDTLVNKSGVFGVANAKLSDKGWYKFCVARNGCYGKDSLLVDVRVLPVPVLRDTFMCSGGILTIDASNADYPGATFVWTPTGTTDGKAQITAGGTYTVAMTYRGCTGNGSFKVNERPAPKIDFPEGVEICQMDSTTLTGPEGMDSYLWQDGSTQKDYVVKGEGEYTLVVEMNGCFAEASTMVREIFCAGLYFPSAFTPNGDYVNDEFGPITTALDEHVDYVLRIFNRNGQKVFESNSLKGKWDGTFKGQACPGGVYMYDCRAKAKKEPFQDLSTRGTVTLIR